MLLRKETTSNGCFISSNVYRFVAIGVPISFALGVVSFTGIASLGQIPNLVVFQKMFNGLNSFTLLAVPLFILAANLMNEGEITEKLIDCCNSLVGHLRGGLAYSNVLVSMIFAGISGSSQADTAGVGKIFIPAMEKQGYDKGNICWCYRSIFHIRFHYPSKYHHGRLRRYC